MRLSLCLLLGLALLLGTVGCTGGSTPIETTGATEHRQEITEITEPSEKITEATEPMEETTEATEPEFVDGQEYVVKKLIGITSLITEDGGEPFPVRTEYTYEDNRLVAAEHYRGDVLITQWTYDGSIDRLLTEEHFFDDGEPDYRIVYTYNSDGKRLTENWFRGDELLDENSYSYDDQGNLILWSCISGGEEIQRMEKRYDERGNLIRLISYDAGSIWLTEEYRYDDRGALLTVDRVREGIKETQVYTYDEGGRWMSATSEDSRWLYTYDGEGRLTLVTVLEQDSETLLYRYQYNASGRMTLYADMGEEHTYHYDTEGNLTDFYACYPSSSQEARLEYETVTVSGEIARELARLQDSLIADPVEVP